MSRDPERLPLATEEMEARVRRTFPLDTPPEVFAARDGHGWLDFPFDRYRYRDARLQAWLREVGAILRDPERLAACRARHLSPRERAALERFLRSYDDLIDD